MVTSSGLLPGCLVLSEMSVISCFFSGGYTCVKCFDPFLFL